MSAFELTTITAGPFETNTYLIEDRATRKGALVDPGYEAERVWPPVIEQKGLTLEAILLTHGHIDHVAGVAAMARLVPEARILIHRIDAPLLTGDNAAATAMFGLPPYEPAEPTHYLEEGQPVSVGETRFEVLFVPGHCPGHVALLHDRTLIAGDVLFAGSIGRTDLPGGDYAQLAASIVNKILPLGDDVTIYPGHGPPTTIGRERATNPFVLQMIESGEE